MFYTYNQNNSGGSFEFDPERGISTVVIVEADSETEADEQAEKIGLYFDGAGDCECCGDRWYNAYGGNELPTIYGRAVELYEPGCKWQGDGNPEVYVHYADGRLVAYCL